MKIFLAGAVSSADEKQLSKYNAYKDILQDYGELTVPDIIWDFRQGCIEENPEAIKLEIDRMMVDFDLKRVKDSDLIVCDLSMQSTGVGIELGVAHENKNIIVFCYEKGSYISSMITGAFSDCVFLEYDNVQDLKQQLGDIINNFNK